MFFDGFALERIDTGEATIRVRHGGDGPPVVLLHGHPRTHTTWHAVAPRLAGHHVVVAPDLRGYGRSTLPPDARSGALKGEFVREFPDLPRVEGIAITEDGRFFYVTDEDEGVHLRLTRLLAD